MMGGRRTRAHGFTLLELLIAIALIMALFAALFSFLWNIVGSRARAVEASGKHLAATTLIERIEADMLACLVGDASAGAGVSGDNSRLTILTRTVPVSLAQRGADSPDVLGDLQRTEYRFNESDGAISARRTFLGAEASSGGGFETIGEPIYLLRFRFHDGTAWVDSFDTLNAGQLPVAIEIAIWFEPWPGAEPLESASDDEAEAQTLDRLTFDADAGFDEQEYLEQSAMRFVREPTPDRVRIIIAPDATTDDGSTDPTDPGDLDDLTFAPLESRGSAS